MENRALENYGVRKPTKYIGSLKGSPRGPFEATDYGFL